MWRSHFLNAVRHKKIIFAVGIILSVASYFFYATKGYSPSILFLWLSGIICIALSLFQNTDQGITKSISWKEIAIPILLIILFSPIYLYSLSEIPVQVNTDEIVIGNAARDFTEPHSPDLFAPSSYFDFPGFIFILFGWIAKWFGGITFENMRLVHALFGLSIVIPAYFFFRLMLPRLPAALGTIAILSNHALIAISRMVSRNNVALLNELAAFAFLFLGVQRKSRFYIFIGGAIAGISFYHYPPARLIFFIWTAAFICMAFFSRKETSLLASAKLFFFSLFGFLMVVTPMLIANSKVLNNGVDYGRQQLLIYPEGRALQASWYGVSEREGILRNIRQGLRMFNTPLNDQAYIYPNLKHGFVDKGTGILLWIGILITLVAVIRKRDSRFDVFFLSGFFALWGIYLFVLGQAPNYTRLFLIIPFVVFFVIRALTFFVDFIGTGVYKLTHREMPFIKNSLLAAAFLAIAGTNLAMFGDFVRKGMHEGNDVGSTGRYIEAREDIEYYAFYIAADSGHPYYGWANESAWESWASFFKAESQSVEVVDPSNLVTPITERPFTIFMSDKVWQEQRNQLAMLYPRYEISNIITDGKLIAFEVTE